MYCMLTHLVCYGKYPTDHYSFPAAGASGIVHAMHASFDSLVVKDNFSLLIIFSATQSCISIQHAHECCMFVFPIADI